MIPIHRVLAIATVIALIASPSAAQRQAPASPDIVDWQHGSMVSVEAGAATASSDTSGMLGVSLGWELQPRLAFEGRARWVDRRGDANGFNAALLVSAGLRRADVSPFVQGGVGLFRYSSPVRPDAPAFYGRRMQAGSAGRVTFTDPSFHVGGGVSVFLSRHVAIQPVGEVIAVVRGSHSYTFGVAAVRLAYHFEDHPVTPYR